jgi:phosphate transport system protein
MMKMPLGASLLEDLQMTRQVFDRELKDLQNKLLSLGSAVEEDLEKSVKALFTGNKAISQRLIDFDEWVNSQRIEIVMGCLTLIATQQPTGSDMRTLAANIEIAGELERIHDYIKGISRISLMLGDEVFVMEPSEMAKLKQYLPQMASITQGMLHDALDAFINNDAEAIKTIPPRDDEVDALFKEATHVLAISVTKEISTYEQSNVLQWAVHNLERSADRVINICEWVSYMITGKYAEMDGAYGITAVSPN